MGVDHDKIILLSPPPFQPSQCWVKTAFPHLLYYTPARNAAVLGAIDALARGLHKICLHSTGADINLILRILSNFMNMSSCLFVLSIN